MVNKEILANPDPSMPHCHCASVALTAAGDVLVAWYGYTEKETSSAVMILARKPAGATRFQRPQRILSDMSSSLGNPVLFSDAEGCLHLLFVALRGHYWDSAILYASNSNDAGHTWTPAESLRMPPGLMVRYPPILRRNGYFLLPAYDESDNRTILLTAGPDGRGWMSVARFEDTGAIQGCIARRNDSQLTMILRPTGDTRRCLRVISNDDGRTWSGVVGTSLPNPLSGVSAYYCDDELFAMYNHTTKHQRFPLSVARSTDGGVSWTEPKHLDETQQEVSYPATVVDDNCVVHAVYTFGRNRIQYVSFDRDWWTS